MRSKRAFKGFLLRAESGKQPKMESNGNLEQPTYFPEKSNQTGSWYIPYLEDNSYLSESRYLHCQGGQQNAVTHSGRTATMFVVSFQWKPPASFQGRVVFRATVVVNYRLFWVDITAAPVLVGDQNKAPRKYFRYCQQYFSEYLRLSSRWSATFKEVTTERIDIKCLIETAAKNREA